MAFHHETVLQRELVDALALKPGDVAIDCTVGGGGHTAGLLEAVGASGLVIGIDRDPEALRAAETRLASYVENGRLRLRLGRFSEVSAIARAEGVYGRVAGIGADIGVSSPQIDQAQRGFSFQKNGPLDMRMGAEGQTAADFIATATLDELIKVFRDYGEEPKARYIARAIIDERAKAPIATTSQLADLVAASVHYKEKSRKHPATKVFQALRIAVNDELGELERLVGEGFEALSSGGRLAIITFHSLEDRLVKHAFQDLSGKKEAERLSRDLPLTEAQLRELHHARARIVRPFPINPTEEELTRNPRARSARLRVLEKD